MCLLNNYDSETCSSCLLSFVTERWAPRAYPFACLLIIPMNLIRSKRLLSVVGRGADLYCALGGIICNLTQFCPIFNMGGGMNLDHDFFSDEQSN